MKWRDVFLIVILMSVTGCAGAPAAPTPTLPQPTATPEPAMPTETSIPPTPEPTPASPTPTPAEADRPPGEMVQSEEARVTSPDVTAETLETLAADNSAFAFDLYQILDKEGNLFYSPHSISLALAMTYAGAEGDTAQQMADVMHFDLPEERLHPAFNALDLALTRTGGEAGEEMEERFQLNVANAIWGQQRYDFLSAYLDLLARNYGAGLRVLDFEAAPEEARETINEWVSQATEGKIKDLIPRGGINPLTRLVLTNAIYFNAAWRHPFKEEQTEDGPFYPLAGAEITVPMMRQTEEFGYVVGEGFQAIELPYVGDRASMLILLPDAGAFESFEGSLDAKKMDAIVQQVERRNMILKMPKFTFETRLDLAQVLANMGMKNAFDPRAANFSGMNGERELFIQGVLHKAFVAVDEAGTEAAAATGVVVGITAMPAEPIEVTVDRPFIFTIRDTETGAVLFLGRVTNPGS